jgi:AraC family transcriptional regulator, transcriptional activator of pobA
LPSGNKLYLLLQGEVQICSLVFYKMAEEIKKLKFKRNADLQVEVVPLHTLTVAKKEHLITPHRTNFYHIFLFENCQPTHFIDFKGIKIQPYSLLFIEKDRVHQFDQLLNYEGQVLIFTDDFFCTNENDTKYIHSCILFNNLSDRPTLEIDKPTFNEFLTICNKINDELSVPIDHLQHTILKNHLHNFLLLAEREKIKQGFTELQKGADLDYTLLFRDLLESNYTKLKGVKDYATLICISEKRLAQATRVVLGKAPKEMINDRIVLEAKRLLVHTNLSVKEIGQSLGFDDPAYFIRYFKKNTATTPIAFKETYLKK